MPSMEALTFSLQIESMASPDWLTSSTDDEQPAMTTAITLATKSAATRRKYRVVITWVRAPCTMDQRHPRHDALHRLTRASLRRAARAEANVARPCELLEMHLRRIARVRARVVHLA